MKKRFELSEDFMEKQGYAIYYIDGDIVRENIVYTKENIEIEVYYQLNGEEVIIINERPYEGVINKSKLQELDFKYNN